MRLAFIVSHPIQYYVPIYRELAKRIREAEKRPGDEETKTGKRESPKDRVLMDEGAQKRKTDDRLPTADDSPRISAVKVFYTWRDAVPTRDLRFEKTFAWDIPLMEGYDFEVVPNTSSNPGTHHRKGLINPDLVERAMAWKPDIVHITGYNYVSHGRAIKELSKAGIPVIFRGDSHLLDGRGPWMKWVLKNLFISRVYRRPDAFAYVGLANRDYYRAFGVPERKLFPVPHTIDVARFAEPNNEMEAKAMAWRRELGISDDHFVFLYAAKLEPRKRPVELLEAFVKADIPRSTLLFVGSGELENTLKERVFESPQSSRASRQHKPADNCQPSRGFARRPVGKTADSRGKVLFLEFQNQSVMPLVYRLGDALVLPSGYWETWGLAVNEAQACGRPALVSDCVGCAQDIIRESESGAIFRTDDWEDCVRAMKQMLGIDWKSKREAIRAGAWKFDTARGVDALLSGLRCMAERSGSNRSES